MYLYTENKKLKENYFSANMKIESSYWQIYNIIESSYNKDKYRFILKQYVYIYFYIEKA